MTGSKAHRTLEAKSASEGVAKLLGLESGAPVLHIERVTVAAGAQPTELLSATYRGDRFKYTISL